MKRYLILAIILIAALPAHAQTIQNPSFETAAPLISESHGPYSLSIPGWTCSGQCGVWQPASIEFAALPDGKQVAWSNGGTISQDLGVVPQASTAYTLKVFVSHRSDDYVNSSATYTLSLNAGTV